MATNSTTTSIVDSISRILDKGTITAQCDTCCPNCGNLYIYASVETFLKVAESPYIQLQPLPGNFPVIPEAPCCFEDCVPQLENLLGSSNYDNVVLNNGIVEYSTLKNKSYNCLLLDFAKSFSLSGDDLAEVLNMILDKGFVTACSGGNQIVASAETFLKWVEGRDFYQDEYCCISQVSGVETYLKLAEAMGWLIPQITLSVYKVGESDYGVKVDKVIGGELNDTLVFSGTLEVYPSADCSGPSSDTALFSGVTLLPLDSYVETGSLYSPLGDPPEHLSMKITDIVVNSTSLTTSPQAVLIGGTTYIINGQNVCKNIF